MSDQEIIRPLVDRIIELSRRPQEQFKKELWGRHNALAPTGKIPACVTFEGIPSPQWDLVFGGNHLRCKSSLARYIEFYIKRRVWMAENVSDDHVIWAALPVPGVLAGQYDWGVRLQWRRPDAPLGARQVIAPFKDKIALSRLRPPRTELDESATAARLDEASELMDGGLAVYPLYPALGNSPFEYAARMRGMGRLFLDVYDCPQTVHGMMDFITGAMIADHERREERGWINCPVDPSGRYQMVPIFRHIAAYLPADFSQRRPLLADEWAYISAQSASEFGPDTYEEFVHRYGARIAGLFANKTVYYHGCECLDQKLDVLATLPNLRRHHVSPWSSVRLAAERYQGLVNLEVHVHPSRVLLGGSPDDMKTELEGLLAEAGGHPLSLNLSDIHSLGGNPDTLHVWAEIAQELAVR